MIAGAAKACLNLVSNVQPASLANMGRQCVQIARWRHKWARCIKNGIDKHCSEPVPGCTPCCNRRSSGSIRGSSDANLAQSDRGRGAPERAAAGRLHAYRAPATPKTSQYHAHPILCC